ncbi:hypothetical protein HDE_12982 [Halotydeus destructor]|nr:hypothetical protein HDE_12982 [Halotydeus destructor]
MSLATRDLLVKYFPSFVLELRGEVQIKGKGVMTTYWLISEQNRPKPPEYSRTISDSSTKIKVDPIKSNSSFTNGSKVTMATSNGSKLPAVV